ncbi:MAG TPA: M20 family metallopeptidase [Anaerolineales bacterium]|nr:M20 family metallopeptidase [Anaerolineales bacterium]
MQPIPISEFKRRLPDQLSLLRTLVEMESPTTDKPALDAVGRFVAEQMAQRGAKVSAYPQARAGDHWLGTWEPSAASGDADRLAGSEKKGAILLLTHLDTVYPTGTLARMPCYEEDGRLYGPGVLDMKSGVAIALIALETLRAVGRQAPRPVRLLCTSDEETGSYSSRELIEGLAREHELVLCLEPGLPDGALKTWRKGIGDFRLEASGRSAHAGNIPQEGVNAILEMAFQLQRLAALADDGAGTTMNVGRIEGGTRTNVVPDACVARLEFRVLDRAEQERVQSALDRLTPILEGAQVRLEGGWNRPPMPRTPGMIAAFERAKGIAAGLGLELKEGGTGGGSDANFVAPLGVPVIDGLGAVGKGAHSEREHILLASLPKRTALLAALLTEW